MAGFISVFVFCLFAVFDSVVAEYCYESRYSFHGGYETRKIHCSFGCCGPAYDEYCCVSNAGIIVGIVFAAIFGIALVASLTCCFFKQKNNRGRVVRPTGGVAAGHQTHNNVFIVPSGPAPPAYGSATVAYNPHYNPYPRYAAGPSAPMPPAYSQTSSPLPPFPPAYSKETAPPPAYSYDAAYPPGNAALTPGAYPPQIAGAYSPQTSGAYPPPSYPPQNPPQA